MYFNKVFCWKILFLVTFFTWILSLHWILEKNIFPFHFLHAPDSINLWNSAPEEQGKLKILWHEKHVKVFKKIISKQLYHSESLHDNSTYILSIQTVISELLNLHNQAICWVLMTLHLQLIPIKNWYLEYYYFKQSSKVLDIC